MRADRIGAAGLAVLALASIGSGVWAADAQPPATQEPVVKQHDTFQGAVSTPIEDLNMKKVPIPDVLNRAVAKPYDLKGMDRCPAISAEVARIDAALGPDKDAPPPPDTRTVGDKRHDSAASVLKFGVEAVTPYRGVVRRVTMALTGFAGVELRYASGLFNLMRNLGGAIGIAVVNTWLADNTRIQAARMGESLGEAGRRAPDYVAALAGQIGGPDPAHALLLAQGELGRLVGRYALTSAFDEVFRLMAWLFIAALIMVPFCKMPAAAASAPPVEAH